MLESDDDDDEDNLFDTEEEEGDDDDGDGDDEDSASAIAIATTSTSAIRAPKHRASFVGCENACTPIKMPGQLRRGVRMIVLDANGRILDVTMRSTSPVAAKPKKKGGKEGSGGSKDGGKEAGTIGLAAGGGTNGAMGGVGARSSIVQASSNTMGAAAAAAAAAAASLHTSVPGQGGGGCGHGAGTGPSTGGMIDPLPPIDAPPHAYAAPATQPTMAAMAHHHYPYYPHAHPPYSYYPHAPPPQYRYVGAQNTGERVAAAAAAAAAAAVSTTGAHCGPNKFLQPYHRPMQPPPPPPDMSWAKNLGQPLPSKPTLLPPLAGRDPRGVLPPLPGQAQPPAFVVGAPAAVAPLPPLPPHLQAMADKLKAFYAAHGGGTM